MKKVVNLDCGLYGNDYSQLRSNLCISFGPRDNQEDDNNNLPSTCLGFAMFIFHDN